MHYYLVGILCFCNAFQYQFELQKSVHIVNFGCIHNFREVLKMFQQNSRNATQQDIFNIFQIQLPTSTSRALPAFTALFSPRIKPHRTCFLFLFSNLLLPHRCQMTKARMGKLLPCRCRLTG